MDVADRRRNDAEQSAVAAKADRDHWRNEVRKRDEDIRRLEQQTIDKQPPLQTAHPDALAERDVVRKVEQLNEEIFQLAALMADWAIPLPDGQMSETDRRTAYRKARVMLGDVLHGVMRKARDRRNDAILTLSLQAAVCRLCSNQMSRWTRMSEELESELRTVFDAMRRSEDSHVADEWKRLTTKHLTRDDNHQPPPDDVLRAIDPVLQAGSLSIPQDKHSLLHDEATSIMKLCVELRHDIHVGITSRHLEVTLPSCGDTYASAFMEVEEGKVKEGESVAACVALGIVRYNEGAPPHGLLKAKVLVQSTIKNILACST